MHFPANILHRICKHFGNGDIAYKSISGGSINYTFQLTTYKGYYCCKINNATKFPHLFQTEAASLNLLESSKVISTPKVNLLVDDGEHQALVMEWIITGNRTKGFWKRLGIQLAQLHTVSNPYFGLDTDNYMGSVPQRNSLTPDWIGFFIQNRISPLIEQCIERKLLSKQHEQQFEKLFIQLHSIMSPEKPSLLHGDLWSGNFMCDNKESPVFIDPAAYFGHRSMDLAMTTLFGGFDPVFYQAYNYHFPFPDNYKEQWAVCNLYPLLIHLLLFGKTYLSSIETTLKEFQ